MRIPTLAIHLDRGVHDGFKVNTQSHLAPVLATSVKAELNKPTAENGSVETGSLVGKKFEEGANSGNPKHHLTLLQPAQAGCEPDDICDFELQAWDTQQSTIAGALKEFIFSGRLDNLFMSFCSLKALLDTSSSESSLENETGVRMVAFFDHEEIGSNSAQGAGSPFMLDALSRITSSFNSGTKDKHEESHQPKMHGGLVIKHNANHRYATNAITSFTFREIANMQKLPVQV